jgi:hypothetical protein
VVQAQWLAPAEVEASIERRLWWAYSRAAKAMLVTTITDGASFLSSMLSVPHRPIRALSFATFTALVVTPHPSPPPSPLPPPPSPLTPHPDPRCIVPNLVSFAIFTTLLALANLALVTTFWPCALVLHQRYCSCSCSTAPLRRLRSIRTPSPARIATSSTAEAHATDAALVEVAPASLARDDTHAAPALSSPHAGPPHTSSSAAAAASARRPKPRLLERWLAESYVPWISVPRHALMLIFVLGGASVALGPHAFTIAEPTRDVMVWRRSSNEYRFLEMRDKHLVDAHRSIALLWGVRAVDRTGTDLFDEDDLGKLVWDSSFDAAVRAITRPRTLPPTHDDLAAAIH